ncbi:MAG: toxin-antitoxin system HicB family antitoxin [Bdellovibrio sp.]
MGSRRAFSGQVHVRLSPEMHEKIAKEAFEKGTSISGIIAQSVSARDALREIDPWKTVEEIWEANRGIDQKQLEKDIADSIKAVRKQSRRG